jgi:hypothetical protein
VSAVGSVVGGPVGAGRRHRSGHAHRADVVGRPRLRRHRAAVVGSVSLTEVGLGARALRVARGARVAAPGIHASRPSENPPIFGETRCFYASREQNTPKKAVKSRGCAPRGGEPAPVLRSPHDRRCRSPCACACASRTRSAGASRCSTGSTRWSAWPPRTRSWPTTATCGACMAMLAEVEHLPVGSARAHWAAAALARLDRELMEAERRARDEALYACRRLMDTLARAPRLTSSAWSRNRARAAGFGTMSYLSLGTSSGSAPARGHRPRSCWAAAQPFASPSAHALSASFTARSLSTGRRARRRDTRPRG